MPFGDCFQSCCFEELHCGSLPQWPTSSHREGIDCFLKKLDLIFSSGYNQYLLLSNCYSFFVFQIHYVIQNLGGAATTLTSASSINAIIGTPPGPLRKQSQLQWRLGTTHLLEDSCQPQFIQTAFRLGPHYTGSEKNMNK